MAQPYIDASNGRRFAAFAAAVIVLIVDPTTRRFLMLSSPRKRGRPGWEAVNGAVEAGEALIEAVEREVAEEAGAEVAIEHLGAVDAWTYRYDDRVPHMISIAFAATYVSGEIVPGDDMAGCEARWMTVDELRDLEATGVALVPEDISTYERALVALDAMRS
ncbi:MAG TPA: NUDIX domain-containing protein [Acidimicrobiales bacterium]|jgi:NADH pyrophosphatase NudC (nudix superfamily)|nr:NUDIX domain-containing protein [Acidimicrobiales bacterium]